jgi:predicted dehydrogenase
MDGQVRAGIIGCGSIAKTHAAALAALPEATFAACCDVDEGRARALADQYGAPHVFTDVQALLTSGTVDMVTICTPHPSHAGLVIAAAEAGIHVLCEKPLTIDLSEADRMVEAAERAGIKFGGIFQRRFWPAAQRVHEAVEAGDLGRMTLAECQVRIWRPREYFDRDEWRGKWTTEGGGALMNQAVHAIDLFQWYMGPVKEIFGRYATLLHGDYIDVEDTVVATVVFENGALGIIEAATTVNPNMGFKVAVHGTKGGLLSLYEQPEGVAGVIDLNTIAGQEEHTDVYAEGRESVPGFPEFHRLQIADFVRAVRDDRQPAVTGAEARKALEIILAIYHSSRTGLPVRLPLDRAALVSAQP